MSQLLEISDSSRLGNYVTNDVELPNTLPVNTIAYGVVGESSGVAIPGVGWSKYYITGTTIADGVYTYTGISAGIPYWNLDSSVGHTSLFNTGNRWQIDAYIGGSYTGDAIASTGDYTSISVDKATGWYVLSGWTTKGGTLPPSIVAVTSNTAILTVTGTTTQYYVGYKSITSPTISTTTTNLSTMIAKLDNIIGSSTGVAYFAAGA